MKKEKFKRKYSQILWMGMGLAFALARCNWIEPKAERVEAISLEEGHTWFPNRADPFKYCVDYRHGFELSEAGFRSELELALEAWSVFFKQNYRGYFFPMASDYAVHGEEISRCDQADLVVSSAIREDELSQFRPMKADSLAGLGVRELNPSGSVKGTIWIHTPTRIG